MPDLKPSPPLQGCRILVVEDDHALADELHRGLMAQGAEVMGPAPSGAMALALLGAEGAPDAALLDMSLASEMILSVADALQSQSIPYVFVTACADEAIPEAYAHVPRFDRPVDLQEVARWLVGSATRDNKNRQHQGN